MKQLLAILILLLVTGETLSQSQWLPVETPATARLNRLHFADSLRGWAVGDSGTIIATTNGGRNWSLQESHIRHEILDIFFLDTLRGWATAWDLSGSEFKTVMLFTTNGGAYWDTMTVAQDGILIAALYFRDSLNGYCGGYRGFIAGTYDGGRTWETVRVDSNFFSGLSIFNIQFATQTLGIATGGQIDIAGAIWRTEDGGDSWATIGVCPEPVHNFHFYDSLRMIGTGGDWEYGTSVVRSTDGGLSFTCENLPYFGIGSSLAMRKTNEFWIALGTAAKLLYSLDDGNTWSEYITPHFTAVYDLVFIDSLHGVACGEMGSVFLFSDSVVSVNDAPHDPPVSYAVISNYPNPFNPETTISFRLPAKSNISLDVYDVRGRFIRNLRAGVLEEGNHIAPFSSDDLPSGVFVARLSYVPVAGNVPPGTVSRKMVLIR